MVCRDYWVLVLDAAAWPVSLLLFCGIFRVLAADRIQLVLIGLTN